MLVSDVPVVLSREEVDRVIGCLSPPYDLVVKLLYGCGLRLFEGIKLRVQDFNFDAMVLTVHEGKGMMFPLQVTFYRPTTTSEPSRSCSTTTIKDKESPLDL